MTKLYKEAEKNSHNSHNSPQLNSASQAVELPKTSRYDGAEVDSTVNTKDGLCFEIVSQESVL